MYRLNSYIEQFKDVRPNQSHGSKSPHKASLLFAVMDLIQDGIIVQNQIFFDDGLKDRFAWYFNRFKKKRDQLDATKPFFYLRTSDFWHHQIRPNAAEQYRKIKTPSEKSILETIEFAYLDQALFDLIQNPKHADQLRAALVANLDSNQEGFKDWAKAIGQGEAQVSQFIEVLSNEFPKTSASHGALNSSIFEIKDYFEISKLITTISEMKEPAPFGYLKKDQVVSALSLYRAYLDQLTDASAQSDIDTIVNDPTIPETSKPTLIHARRGQGKFRERLIKQWNGCAVTGYGNISMLMASHIKPWATCDNSERLDPYNGLLLSPNLDKAFDLHFISFTDKGRILISEQLGDFKKLGIHTDMEVKLSKQHQKFMDEHRDVFHSTL
ncbi:HNH endonuclease [Pseudidiomarina sp. YC-516-91]|uniref:HNH endonuclease n=1 Tax=Pseudidiomarina salilacus TaxID=3384452 RepID=UPI0039847AE4